MITTILCTFAYGSYMRKKYILLFKEEYHIELTIGVLRLFITKYNDQIMSVYALTYCVSTILIHWDEEEY